MLYTSTCRFLLADDRLAKGGDDKEVRDCQERLGDAVEVVDVSEDFVVLRLGCGRRDFVLYEATMAATQGQVRMVDRASGDYKRSKQNKSPRDAEAAALGMMPY